MKNGLADLCEPSIPLLFVISHLSFPRPNSTLCSSRLRGLTRVRFHREDAKCAKRIAKVIRNCMAETFDVVVIGGGPAGSTAARLLAQWGHSTLILNKPPAKHPALAESLPPTCRKLFG